jgi:tripeptide aminopeptidase
MVKMGCGVCPTSRLSEMGLPTPNIFTGGHEHQSVGEWASVQDMAAAAATVVRLAEVWAGGSTA